MRVAISLFTSLLKCNLCPCLSLGCEVEVRIGIRIGNQNVMVTLPPIDPGMPSKNSMLSIGIKFLITYHPIWLCCQSTWIPQVQFISCLPFISCLRGGVDIIYTSHPVPQLSWVWFMGGRIPTPFQDNSLDSSKPISMSASAPISLAETVAFV